MSLLSKGNNEHMADDSFGWKPLKSHRNPMENLRLVCLLAFPSFLFQIPAAGPQSATVRFNLLVFSASSPAERKRSCILSAYSIFPLRSSLEAEPNPSSRRRSIHSNICFMQLEMLKKSESCSELNTVRKSHGHPTHVI